MAVNLEDEFAYVAPALPTPTDTPYRTPSRSLSRASAHRGSSSPGPSSSPPLFPPVSDSYSHGRNETLDVANDENISPLDPRRFTPTLHASLVSEILSLRRDLESRTRTIESLETSLHTAKSEYDTLNESLSTNSKESLSLKRQMQLLEGGTLSALSELAKERDEALDSLSDVRKRLDQSQKKVRNQEEETERTQSLWDRDKQTWESDRRTLERKVHIVEGRLKIVLSEVTAAQANGHHPHHDGEHDEIARDGYHGRGSDTTSIRSSSVLGRQRTSTTSNSTHDGEPHGHRVSVIGLVNGHGSKLDGQSLAEELAFDEEDEDNMDRFEDDDDGPTSPDALPEERPMSVQSRPIDAKARKVLGLPVEEAERFGSPELHDHVRSVDRMPDFDEEDEYQPVQESKLEYKDVAIQYSPPPSPKLAPQSDMTLKSQRSEETMVPFNDTGANQGRKRVSVNTTTMNGQVRSGSPIPSSTNMTSTSCQTIGELPSPPWTPNAPEALESPSPITIWEKIEMASTSTQTDEIESTKKQPSSLSGRDCPYRISVPTIAIHPPASGPTSPRNSVVLPPHTKNACCQVNLEPSVEVRSVAMQTEEIRIDMRPVKLAPHLLPSALSSQPLPEEPVERPVQGPIPAYRVPSPRSSRRKLRSPPPIQGPPLPSRNKQLEKAEAYSGNNDNGPLTINLKADIRRPLRSSSLFAGFGAGSDDEAAEAEEEKLDEDDLFSRPMVSYTLKSGKLVSKAESSVPEEDELHDKLHDELHDKLHDIEEPNFPELEMQEPPLSIRDSLTLFNQHALRKKTSTGKLAERRQRPPKPSSSMKQPDIRRAALISSGTAAHQSTRPRSPSAPSIGSNGSSTSAPPFPVPTRLSSRKIPISSSEGARSPTPTSGGVFPERFGKGTSRKPPLRKVRSAAAIPRFAPPERQRSRSPPPLSASSAAPDSPHFPPMPFDEVTAPRDKRAGKLVKPRPELSTSRSHSRNASASTSVQQTSVVDAIAQTMVGEWMFKYVRRRKSFGVPDSAQSGWEIGGRTGDELSANITNSGVRHKRWVWLAPYERAVMWSSKQPTSGSALLGKSGRKLSIQSVLDVKDDNPLPKGSSSQMQFNRSILILTPQRALKFTAMSQERHYVWLTALSFLSHSPLGINDLATLPPVPQEEYIPPSQTASLRRNPIRDSIRVAKGKGLPTTNGVSSFTTGGAIPSHTINEVDLHYAPNEPISDAADPPNIPSSRKRSNTAPRPPPSAFRSYSSNAAAPSTYSATTAASSDIYTPTSVGGPGFNSGQSSFSRRTSEASGPSGIIVNNFFDAVGTVRMEAFVDRPGMPRPRQSYRTRQGRKKDMSYWGAGPGPEMPFERPDESDAFFRSEDPFGGF